MKNLPETDWAIALDINVKNTIVLELKKSKKIRKTSKWKNMDIIENIQLWMCNVGSGQRNTLRDKIVFKKALKQHKFDYQNLY